MTDQPVFEADYVEQRSRLTTFFRLILAIPHLIVLSVWGFLAFFAVVVAWFAILVSGNYPAALYQFVAGFARYATAAYGYVYLLTDQYPPFSGDTGSYPVRLRLAEYPKMEYSRVKTLFRIILMIPPYIIAYAMGVVAQVGALLAWFVIVITGKQPSGLQEMTVLGLSYQQRVMPYYTLLTEDWPSFTSPQRGTLGGGGDDTGLPAASTGTFAAPEAPTAPGAPRGGVSGGDPLNG